MRFSGVSTVAVLLVALSSGVVADTLATFTIGPRPGYVIGTVKVAVIVRVAPAGTTPSAHGKAVVQVTGVRDEHQAGRCGIAHHHARGV